jgi:hypothetical protein
MANAIQNSGRNVHAQPWLDEDVIVIGVSAGYSHSAAHTSLADIPSGARVFTSDPLTGKSVTNGVCDANDVDIAGLADTDPDVVGLAVIYLRGTEAGSPFALWFDTDAAAQLINYSPSTNTLRIRWSNGVNRIFRV